MRPARRRIMAVGAQAQLAAIASAVRERLPDVRAGGKGLAITCNSASFPYVFDKATALRCRHMAVQRQ